MFSLYNDIKSDGRNLGSKSKTANFTVSYLSELIDIHDCAHQTSLFHFTQALHTDFSHCAQVSKLFENRLVGSLQNIKRLKH